MRYMLLITRDTDAWNKLTPQQEQGIFGEFMTYTAALTESKEYESGAPLQTVDTATTVRQKGGERLVSDGPFAETKEVLGGYFIIDVADLDRALEIAAEMPSTRHEVGSVEVRPLQEVPGM
jgi:hypothetical protein